MTKTCNKCGKNGAYFDCFVPDKVHDKISRKVPLCPECFKAFTLAMWNWIENKEK